jgi:hypothetical protein
VEDALTKQTKLVTAVLVAALLGAGLFVLGRVSAPAAAPRSGPQPGDYFDGLRVGEAQGRRDGRALQEGVELPRGERDVARHAFDAGYVAGMNDAFAGYDGGWALHVPWIITVEGGSGQVVYRIRDREQVRAGIDYYLCADGHTVCQQPRR